MALFHGIHTSGCSPLISENTGALIARADVLTTSWCVLESFPSDPPPGMNAADWVALGLTFKAIHTYYSHHAELADREISQRTYSDTTLWVWRRRSTASAAVDRPLYPFQTP